MKKLMTLMAVVSAAVAANAATVNWNFGEAVNSTYIGSAQDLTGFTPYLIAAADWDTDNVAGSIAKKVASTTWKTATFESNKAAFQTGNVNSSTTLALGDQSFYIVLYDGDKYWASSALTATVLEDGSISTDYKTAKVTLATTNILTPSSFTAVPEPTSGLLMLLGIAGLALRRRKA